MTTPLFPQRELLGRLTNDVLDTHLGPNGQSLSVTVAEDPRSTAGVSFGALDTVSVNGLRARVANGTLSIVPCRGALVSLSSGGLSKDEIAALASTMSVAFPVGRPAMFEFGQMDRPCPVWSH